jgi:glucokinase
MTVEALDWIDPACVGIGCTGIGCTGIGFAGTGQAVRMKPIRVEPDAGLNRGVISTVVLGIDIGNTNHTLALVDSGGAPLEIVRGLTDPEGGPPALLSSVQSLAAELFADAQDRGLRVLGAGVGFGGPVDFPTGIVALSHQTAGWDSFPLRDALTDLLEIPVILDNDANAGGLGEFLFGAARGARDAVYYNIGTGIGGAVILDGKLRRGVTSLAGELGHTTVLPGGPICTCGQRGCLEAVSSGAAIARRIEAVDLEWKDRKATPADFFPLVESGSEPARRLLDEVVDGLAISIRNILHTLNPEVIVLGGGVSRGGETLLDPLREAVQQRTFPRAFAACRIEAATLGYEAGVVGAAALALDPEMTRIQMD